MPSASNYRLSSQATAVHGMRGARVASCASLREFACAQRLATSTKPARILVIGEFNAGKTSFLNALLGEPLLPTSISPNTTHPTVIGFAEKRRSVIEAVNGRRVCFDGDLARIPATPAMRRLHIGLPLDDLKGLLLVDTPGFATGDANRDWQVRRACSRADLIVWCTPAMQAWKASEQRAWLDFPARLRARGILVVSFADLLQSTSDGARLMSRLEAEAGAYFQAILVGPKANAPDHHARAPSPGPRRGSEPEPW